MISNKDSLFSLVTNGPHKIKGNQDEKNVFFMLSLVIDLFGVFDVVELFVDSLFLLDLVEEELIVVGSTWLFELD